MSLNKANSLLPMQSRKLPNFDRLDSSGMEFPNDCNTKLRKTTSDSGASFIRFQRYDNYTDGMANKMPKEYKSSLHHSMSCPSITLICDMNSPQKSKEPRDHLKVENLNHQNMTCIKKKRKKRPSKKKRLKMRLTKLREDSLKTGPTTTTPTVMNDFVRDFCVTVSEEEDEDWDEITDEEADSAESLDQVPVKTRRVRFPSGDKIHIVHEIECVSDNRDWSIIDKQRFKSVIERYNPIISRCFTAEHRRKIYEKLFGCDNL